MRILSTDQRLLVEMSREAAELVCSGNLEALVAKFGYAMTHHRELAQALRTDLQRCLASIEARTLVKYSEPSVTYLKPNATGLLAVVEISLAANNGRALLIELVATGGEGEFDLSLEDVSAVT